MKHGDKAKKSAKAVKASGEKSSSKEVVAKARKESGSSKSGKEAGAKKAAGKAESREAAKAPAKTATKVAAKESGGNGKAKAGKAGGDTSNNGGFANPVVGAAFKRAVKKYSNAFRRLTD